MLQFVERLMLLSCPFSNHGAKLGQIIRYANVWTIILVIVLIILDMFMGLYLKSRAAQQHGFFLHPIHTRTQPAPCLPAGHEQPCHPAIVTNPTLPIHKLSQNQLHSEKKVIFVGGYTTTNRFRVRMHKRAA